MKDITILFIEDDIDILSSASDILEGAGYKVLTAIDGKNGLELARKIKPDLIISDITMPKLNGYEVKLELEKEIETKFIPFIFLTAKAEMKELRYGMEIGADDYIVKPFKIKDLLKSIEIRLNKLNAAEAKDSTRTEEKEDLVERKLKLEDPVFLQLNDKPSFVKIKDIKVISAESEYTYIYLSNGEKYLVRKLLKEWEQILPQNAFLRIHRSTIINLNYVEKIEKWFQRSFKIKIANLNNDYVISQRYAAKLKNNLKL